MLYPFQLKAAAQVTVGAAPAFKGGGAANRGFTGFAQTAAGNYLGTTDGRTAVLVTTAAAAGIPDFPIVTALDNPGAAAHVSLHALILTATTVRVQEVNTANALADADFAILILSLRA